MVYILVLRYFGHIIGMLKIYKIGLLEFKLLLFLRLHLLMLIILFMINCLILGLLCLLCLAYCVANFLLLLRNIKNHF